MTAYWSAPIPRATEAEAEIGIAFAAIVLSSLPGLTRQSIPQRCMLRMACATRISVFISLPIESLSRLALQIELNRIGARWSVRTAGRGRRLRHPRAYSRHHLRAWLVSRRR